MWQIIKGATNGFEYGAKTRFTHSLVIGILFRANKETPLLSWIMTHTWDYSKKLALFALIYKCILILLQKITGKKHPFYALLAGITGGYIVMKDNRIPINYLLARILYGGTKKLSKEGYLP